MVYNVGVNPFFTYSFTAREDLCIYPFVTYKIDGSIDVVSEAYITYIDKTLNGKKIDRHYYCIFYSNYMKKVIKCRLYDNTKYFPLKDVHMSVICDDGKRRYLPLDFIKHDFDSGVRVRDKYGNELQVCVTRQDSIIDKYFKFGNMLIPLTTYNDLYTILTGVFGKAFVSVPEAGNGVVFSPPSVISGITKMFICGLNVRITSMYGWNLTTYEHGLSRTSYGGDKHWMANTMLIKIKHREKFRIEFDNAYYGTSYIGNELVKNSIVIGHDVEGFREESASYNALLRNKKWFLYDIPTNTIDIVDNSNKYIKYYRDKYLRYPNTIGMYNYYDLDKMKYDKGGV